MSQQIVVVCIRGAQTFDHPRDDRFFGKAVTLILQIHIVYDLRDVAYACVVDTEVIAQHLEGAAIAVVTKRAAEHVKGDALPIVSRRRLSSEREPRFRIDEA